VSSVSPEALPPLQPDGLVPVAVLGEGATAKVYRAWMIREGQWCAVKVLKPGKPDKLRRRFLAEAEMLCRLSHRNLVKGFEVSDGEPPWFSMEIADGGSLKDWCTRHGRMAPRLAVDVAIQICKAVSVAHQAGYVHRDIKPHNVLISRRGVCKLTDFGVARVMVQADGEADGDVSLSGDALGTLGYMSPEQQADPHAADARSDVYGIAATLLHLLTGATPPGNLFMATREYPEIYQGIPDALVPILQKATEYRRDDRHPNALELARELHAASEFLPPMGRSPSLTADLPLEPLPPPGFVGRTPPSVPSVDSGPASFPPPEEMPQTPTPAQLRRPEPVEYPLPEPARTRWGLVVVLIATQVFLAFSLDVYWVGSARGRARDTESAFVDAARRHVAVIDELAAAGADRDELAAGHTALRSGSPLVRRDAARRWIDELRAAADAHPPETRVRVVVTSRIDALGTALDPWCEAVDEWRRRSDTLPGAVVREFVGRPDKAEERGR
jgi:serine/threonine protein kinase